MTKMMTTAEATRRLKKEFHWDAVDFERWGINVYTGAQWREEKRRLLNEAYEFEIEDREAWRTACRKAGMSPATDSPMIAARRRRQSP
jgi:hypothetical protein